ncbi:MAG: DNA-formamidopyrimidine glycosylase family protein [Raoultibacter sp.]|jgi:formamidopyrimidine-DNA glycosylase
MIEIPECITLTKQIRESFLGKRVESVLAAKTRHGFGWYNPEPEEYPLLLVGKKLTAVHALGGQTELVFEDMHLVFNDGTTPRYLTPEEAEPKKHQLLIGFDEGSRLVCTVRMYGGMMIYPQGLTDNKYYLQSRDSIMPTTDAFDRAYFQQLFESCDPKLSAKAFLATEQRIPGLGNGVLQDILYNARIHPQKKLKDLDEQDIEALFESVKNTLAQMVEQGGRDVEKGLYGNPGGYTTILSNKTKDEPCKRCGNLIVKKAYMGGNVYFCPQCQSL